MTPVRFEREYGALWRELESGLDAIERRVPAGAAASGPSPTIDAARLAALYRRSCEHLALAQARAYPIRLTGYLQGLTYRAHRLIYRRQDYGAARLRQLVLVDLPQCVRRHRWYLLAAVLLFTVPMLLVAWASYRDPGFALHVLSARDLAKFKEMYAGSEELGRTRDAGGDWSMFGFYILNNISIAFQCFASGIFAGVASAGFLAFNGVYSGAVAGYITREGLGTHFFSFVVTHSAFELTAICIAGAAGLRIGHALVVPGRHTRVESLRLAALDAVVMIYGVFGMLLVAAAIEAFWSSAGWVAPEVKFAVGALAWTLVIAYLLWQGRPAAPPPAAVTHAG
jgi:uncharacterized membrane protein SpoIIM required for sporulation